MEAPAIIEREATEEEVRTKDPLPSATKITKQINSETSNNKFIQLQHFENILGPENRAEMTP